MGQIDDAKTYHPTARSTSLDAKTRQLPEKTGYIGQLKSLKDALRSGPDIRLSCLNEKDFTNRVSKEDAWSLRADYGSW